MEHNIQLVPARERLFKVGTIVFFIMLFLISVHFLELDVERFVARAENFPEVFSRFMALNVTTLHAGIEQLLVSITLGICGLVIGGVVSFALAFLAADNIAFSRALSIFIKGTVSLIRAIPSLVLILMIVASLGMGNTAGVVGLTLSSIGYLTKAFISTIEEQDDAIIETLRSTGASWLQIVVHGFFPNVIPAFLAWLSIRMESSIAESISLGMVGAGGIGMLLSRAIRQHDHPTISTMILLIFITMFLLEIGLNQMKQKLRA